MPLFNKLMFCAHQEPASFPKTQNFGLQLTTSKQEYIVYIVCNVTFNAHRWLTLANVRMLACFYLESYR